MYGSLLVPAVLDKLTIEIMKYIAREYGRNNLILENLRKSITRGNDILEAGEGVAESNSLHVSAFVMGTQSNSYNTVTFKFFFVQMSTIQTEFTDVTDANTRKQLFRVTSNGRMSVYKTMQKV